MSIPLAINTDAHSAGDLEMLPFGVATARRGWAEREDVVNAWGTNKLLDWLKKRGE